MLRITIAARTANSSNGGSSIRESRAGPAMETLAKRERKSPHVHCHDAHTCLYVMNTREAVENGNSSKGTK